MKLLFFILLSFPIYSQELKTFAERNDWKVTGQASETQYLCHAFRKKYPKQVECRTFGKTPEGRNMLAIIAGDRNPKNAVLWVQAGIHAGEIDGKDAVFWLLRDALEKNLLAGVTLIFIPIVNVDGHERFGKYNRPNQIGPEEMGWRVTAQNYNLNRDFMKVDAPEMKALLKLWLKFNPLLSLDLHVTNGAQFRPEIGIVTYPVTQFGNTALHKAGSELEAGMLEKFKARGHLALPFYPSFEEHNNPLSGVSRYVSTPRFSHGYWLAHNRMGMLVESHSWKDYKTRVRAHYSAVLSAIELLKTSGAKWEQASKSLIGTKLAGKDVALTYKRTDKKTLIDFPGYAFEIYKSKISGAQVIRYNTHKLENWHIPFYEELVPELTVKAPTKGYYIQGPYAEKLKEKLDVHGITYSVHREKIPMRLLAFRATSQSLSNQSFEGHQMLTLLGDWNEEEVSLASGSIFVPIDQPKAMLVLQLLEPRAPDSLASWGFLNAAFEKREYMEDYVAEEVATEMLKDPSVRREFEQKLKDQTFAQSPEQRFEFFHRKHPSWDARFGLYPVFKL